MKVALVTTPPSVRSGIGDYTRHLLPYLREHCDVRVFVEQGQDDPLWNGEDARSIDSLATREYDQILYQLGNERVHAFMPRLIRAIGGTVMQHDWVLFDMAMAAWPGLVRGGAKGHALALREGGLGQARVYSANWIERRRQRLHPVPLVDVSNLEGLLLAGWYEPEGSGRWTSDQAWVRIPAQGVESIEMKLHVEPGRTVRVHEGGRTLELEGDALVFQPTSPDKPLLQIETLGIRVTREQRRNGDARRMGCFIKSISWRDGSGAQAVDMRSPSTIPNRPVSLNRDRFRLPLNRSVVRFADAFIVHSRYVHDLVLNERNSPTPIGILHHGAEIRWREDDRRGVRDDLGLAPEWRSSFLIVSFGGVQPHKRIDQALRALSIARRERPDIRLVLAGTMQSQDFDPVALARSLQVEDAVLFTGFLPEERAWNWLHAGDIALNLRGPTTGGTSGGIFQAFSMGRSVIASDAAEQQELPDSCVVKIPLGEHEVETLARELVGLRDAPQRRDRLEEEVRRFVTDQCHWRVVARQYAEYLGSFPGPRAARKKLVALKPARK